MSHPVITGHGIVTPSGLSKTEVLNALTTPRKKRSMESYTLQGFDAARLLSNRRVLKSVGWYHGFSLAAVELCKKSARLDTNPIPAPRLGMYVGAPPSSMYDNTNYIQPVKESKQPDGKYSEKAFGATCMNTLGTTLLLGLPNNVLCYGSMILGAKGPNSNYISSDVSGLMALCQGAWKIADGKIDGAAVGGYSMCSDPVLTSMLRKQNLLFKESSSDDCVIKLDAGDQGTIPADGSVFLTLESEDCASKRDIPPVARFVSAGTANYGRLRYLDDHAANQEDVDSAVYAISQCLDRGQINPDDIGLVFLSGSGISFIDGSEVMAIEATQKARGSNCPVVSLSPRLGNLMESSGLLEAIVGPDVLNGEVKLSEDLFYPGFPKDVNLGKKIFLIVRSSVSGDKICVAFQAI